MNEAEKEMSVPRHRRWVVPVVLIACISIVGFWEVMANRSRRPFQPFDLTSEDFAGFKPSAAGWSFRSMPVISSPTEPNILAMQVVPAPAAVTPVLVRLAHGYNMSDCMRIKGYKVELMEERSQRSEVGGQKSEVGDQKLFAVNDGGQHLFYQAWRLTSGAGDVSIWVTSLLRAGDSGVMDIDVRSMPFPRISAPDDPGWVPHGLTLAGLRHPADNFRLFLRAKWNNSRCDPATFFRLKTPAWASNEILALVSSYKGRSVEPEREHVVMQEVLAVHRLFLRNLQTWSAERDKK